MIPKQPDIIQLFNSFPSLRKAAENNGFDATVFLSAANLIQWAHNAKLKEDGMQAAYFVALVMNNFTKQSGEAKFEFAKAVRCWDDAHCLAFRTWATDYLVPDSHFQPVFNPDNRRINEIL